MSSVWVPSSTATKKCHKSQRRTQRERQRERKKEARPKLGPQKLPTKAFTKSTPSVLPSNPNERGGTGLGQAELDMAASERQWSSPGGGRQQHLISLASAAWPAMYTAVSVSAGEVEGGGGGGGGSLPEQLSDARSAVSQGNWRRETNIYPSTTAAPLLLQPS